MKPEFSRYFLFAYALLGAMHILFHEHETVHHLSKPFLMPLLLLYALSALRKLPGWLVIALLASCLGDSFLMYEARKPVYFVLGLGSFLIAHLAYIILFIKTSEPVSWQLRIKKRGMILGMLLAYTAVLLALLLPRTGALQIPVVVYAVVLCAMTMTAFLRTSSGLSAHALLVALGSVLFVISDSLLAVNKFVFALPYAPVWIMGTYLTAQYWIVRGMVIYEQEKSLLQKKE